MGDGLVGKARQMHTDLIQKSALTEAEYDRLVSERNLLDTVIEERLEGSDIASVGNGTYLKLLEVQAYRNSFHSGKPLLSDAAYDRKKSKAISEAKTCLSSVESEEVDFSTRLKIVDLLSDLGSKNCQARQDIHGLNGSSPGQSTSSGVVPQLEQLETR